MPVCLPLHFEFLFYECFLWVCLGNKEVGSPIKPFVILFLSHIETFLRNDRSDHFELLTHIGRRCTACALGSYFQSVRE